MHFNTYSGHAALMAAALVNARSEDPPVVTALLRVHRVRQPDLDDEQADALRCWANRLSAVFGQTDRSAQIDLVNALLADSAQAPYVSTHDGQPPHMHYVSERSDVVARVQSATAAGLAFSLCNDGGQRLGRCAAQGCRLVFVDVSKGGRRRYCSTRCATRVNVHAHRARHAAGAAGGESSSTLD